MTKMMLALVATLVFGACDGDGFAAAPDDAELLAAVDSGAPVTLDAEPVGVDAEPVSGVDAGRNCARFECQLDCESGAKRPSTYDEPFVGCWCVSHRCIAWHDGPSCSPNRQGCVVLPPSP